MRGWAFVVLGLLLPARSAKGERVVVHRGIERAPAVGPRDAQVLLDLYCDWLQPACAPLHEMAAKLAQKHPTEVRVTYRQLPWPINPYGVRDAEIALEAAAQDRFFVLVESSRRLTADERRDPRALARRIGLDERTLAAALADGRHRTQRENDLVRALRLGESGMVTAPMAVWNAKRSRFPVTPSGYEAAFQDAFERAERMRLRGIPPERLHAALALEAIGELAAVRVARPNTSGTGLGGRPPASRRFNVPTAGAPALGADDAKVVIVVFGDYQCPHSKKLMQVLIQIEHAYRGQVQVVFKHAPLPSNDHTDAHIGAVAAACAQLQDRFWEYHALLWQGPNRLPPPQLEALARNAGLDTAQFARDLAGSRCRGRVSGDIADARALGIYGTTPVFYVNGLEFSGDTTFPQVQQVIEEELEPGLLRWITE